MTICARPVAGLVLCIALIAARAAVAEAQEVPAPTDSTMVMLFERFEDGDSGQLDPRVVLAGSVTAFADGVECTRLDFDGAEGWLVLGEDGQPDVCRTDGTTIIFVNGAGQELFEKPTFVAGTTVRLDNLAPVPPSTGTEAPAPPGAGSGGLAAVDAGHGAMTNVALLLVAGALALGARRWTADGGGSRP
jgi:hypothetical protein